MLLGAHVDSHDPIAHAVELGASCCQFFLGDPQSFKKPATLYADGPAELKTAAEAAGIAMYVHAPYRINVASTNNRLRIPSRKLLQQTIDAAAEIGAKGVIVHGGHVGEGDAVAIGFDNWRKCIDGLDQKVLVLIENTAGGANAMARTLDRLGMLWEAIGKAEGGDQVGFCLDTCHAHAGGNELGGLVERVKAMTGRVDLVHCNDSRDAFNSGADRHANLGKGYCDPNGLADVLTQAQADIILETPDAGIAADLAFLREMFG